MWLGEWVSPLGTSPCGTPWWLSPFLIQKTIETHCKPINIKKAMNNTIIIQTTNQKQSEKILKWKQFGKLNIKTYPHPTLNFSKGVIKSPDLASCSLEEIRLHLKPQGVTDVRRISIRKETSTIDTNTYILTFNKPTIPTSIRIGYINTKIETYIPNPLRCQHPKDKCTRPWICAKCGNSNHTELECKNCINCTGMWNVEKRITEIKYTRNIVEQTQEQPSYACVTKKEN